jgi:hypothetical protein
MYRQTQVARDEARIDERREGTDRLQDDTNREEMMYMPDNDLCSAFSETFEAFTKEITEHKIRENLAKFKRRLPSVKTIAGRDKIQRKIREYERYIAAYSESKKVYDVLCKGKKANVDCKTLVDAKMIWAEEITRYDLFIKLGRMQEQYRALLASYDDVLDEFCFT